MKNITKNIMKYIILTILAFAVTSCATDFTATHSAAENVAGDGSVNVTLMIPDYYGLVSDSRAIAPNTAAIKMQYRSGSSWVDVNNTVDIDSAVTTKASGLPTGVNLPYSKMSTSFTLPKGTYPTGSIKLLLCDSTGTTITSGTNSDTVVVAAGKSATATFYTVPVDAATWGGVVPTVTLAQGQMKFMYKTLQAGTTYSLTLKGSTGTPPVVVMFDANGQFVKYYAPNSDNASFTMTPSKTGLYYLGIWAKDAEVTNLPVKISGTASLFSEDFESSSFTTNNWTLGGNTQPVIGSNETYGKNAQLNANYCKTSTLTKTVAVSGEAELSFMYYQQNYSGMLNYVIDGVSTRGTSSPKKWTSVVVPLTTGSHTISFQSSNMYSNAMSSSYVNEKDTIYIDNIFIKPAAETISEMALVTFDEVPNPNYWNLGSAQIKDFNDSSVIGACHADAFKTNRGKVLNSTYDNAITIRRIKRTSPGILTFWYKNTMPTVTVSGTPYQLKSSSAWKKAIVPIPVGEHTISIKASGYIDDVCIGDGLPYEITPRGEQQTYIGGHTIQYALSTETQNVTWSVSGGGTISSTGLFTPTTAGTFTVTAKIGGADAATATVKVHPNNHGAFTIGETTFTGAEESSLTSGSVGIATFSVMPKNNTECDGFFPLVGTSTPSGGYNVTLVKVTKNGGYSTSYYLQGSFDQRIWLRFGEGDYTVWICDAAVNFRTDIDGNQGSMVNWSYSVNKTLTVTNTAAMSADDAMVLMPSHYINNDDYRIQNVVADVLATLPENSLPQNKLQALHDWETDFLYYDFSSVSSYQSGTYRRHQEAVWVLKNTTAVCEGYATLFASLARAIGVKARYDRSDALCHAYNAIWFADAYLLTDVCWDDPVYGSATPDNKDRRVGKYCYDYFLRTNNDGRDDTMTDFGRGEPVAPLSPDGIERGWF
ncbi:MAG: transglutaminase domain-containing protein [Spirochaetales bacterium]|nr:transglutaminase domain-containing protein [Spirochaetales bacterium]